MLLVRVITSRNMHCTLDYIEESQDKNLCHLLYTFWPWAVHNFVTPLPSGILINCRMLLCAVEHNNKICLPKCPENLTNHKEVSVLGIHKRQAPLYRWLKDLALTCILQMSRNSVTVRETVRMLSLLGESFCYWNNTKVPITSTSRFLRTLKNKFISIPK